MRQKAGRRSLTFKHEPDNVVIGPDPYAGFQQLKWLCPFAERFLIMARQPGPHCNDLIKVLKLRAQDRSMTLGWPEA